GATSYALTIPVSTSTLTSLLTGSQFAGVSSFTVTANWVAFSTGPGTNTSEGYRLQASSTAFDGTGTIYSSTTFVAPQSTLTVIVPSADTIYYLRVGALNWDGTPN